MKNCKMKICWVISLIICQFRQYSCRYLSHITAQDIHVYGPYKEVYSWNQLEHYPGVFTTAMSRYVNGTVTKIPPPDETPDYRIEEPHFLPVSKGYIEYERPYLNSPSKKLFNYYSGRNTRRNKLMERMACYCTTVYKKFTLLAGCAVITTKHVLTTATPTVLILRSYRHKPTLDGIFGGWYDHDSNVFNASMYFQPSRIHIHPRYTYDYEVNVSHPIPAMYDLALIALQNTVFCSPRGCTYVCNRAGSSLTWILSTIPHWSDVHIVGGFQFIKAYNRKPMPWYRYVIHTMQYVWPCPKSDWHWFHCIYGDYWGKFGFDSGGALNTAWNDKWRFDGLSGLCAFSMKLRSKQTVHYFTVIDTYPVLDFLYDAMLGMLKCMWLDDRFEDTKGRSPRPWRESFIPYTYQMGVPDIDDMALIPFY